MRRPPRGKSEPLVTRSGWAAVFGYGFIIAASAIGALAWATLVLGLSTATAVTVSFLTFGFARLWQVFSMRSAHSKMLRNPATDRFVWLALAVGTGLLIAALYLPVLSGVLASADPGVRGWVTVAAFSLIAVILVQPMKQRRLLWEGRWVH